MLSFFHNIEGKITNEYGSSLQETSSIFDFITDFKIEYLNYIHSKEIHFKKNNQNNIYQSVRLNNDLFFLCFQDNLKTEKIIKKMESLQRVSDLNLSRLIDTLDELNFAKNELENNLNIKKEFLARVSHELRTPLTSILGYAELLEDTKLEKEAKNYIKSILDSGKNLMNLINDILDFSKLSYDNIVLHDEEFTIHQLIETITNLTKNQALKKGLNYQINTDIDDKTIFYSDLGRIIQIIENLITNAIKYTEKGFVKLEIYKENQSNTVHLNFVVSDSGIGIEEKNIDSIFDTFLQLQSSNFKGVGLGLSIVKKLVEKFNGTISVYSKVQKGTTFEVKIPVTVKTCKTENHIKFKNALIIDKSSSNRKILKAMLHNFDIQCFTFENLHDAIELIKTNSTIDIVFCDYEFIENQEYKIVFKDLDLVVLCSNKKIKNKHLTILHKPFLIKELTTILNTL